VRPELTAERFMPDRFSSRPNARLYRTGDLGRWLADGRLEHLGRLDHQVKIRGFRVELGEIEAALNSHPAVRQSAVITSEARPGDVRIIAYVALHDGEDLTVSDVRRHLRSCLPDYMLPSFVLTVPVLPLTANGKLDRASLPDPFRSMPHDVKTSEPPAPGMEQQLAAIWRDALKVDGIGSEDNFFELGGHSLLAVQVVAALEKHTGWRMSPRALFFQTLRQVAASVTATAGR
jgi:acyl carrier protein